MLHRSLALLSTLLLFGPPGIQVNPVTNPATAPVPGAVFMITAHHHLAPEGITVTGRAEGIVAGKRVTRPITLTPAGSPTLFAVKPQWESGQAWVLIFTVKEEGHDTNGYAEATVSLTPDGKVSKIDYPMGRLAQGSPWPRRATEQEIAAALAALSPRH